MLVNFLNTFMSYLVQMIVIVAVAGVAVTIGITAAKKKNADAASPADKGEK